MARGRKSNYDERVKPHLKQIKEWKKVGATDKQIINELGVSQAAWSNYLLKHEELKEAVKTGRTHLVMNLRGELARIAFKHTVETKKQYITEDEDGHKRKHTEITTKELDGDVAAINLLLKNLDEEWSNDPANLELRRQELELRKAIAKSNNFELEIEGEKK